MAAIFVPILIITGWIGSYSFITQSGSTVRLRIEGYDPRDLLAGHYLRYRVNYGDNIECPANDQGEGTSWCLCLDQKNGKFSQVSSQGSCDEFSDCRAGMIKGTCKSQRFEAGIERFYFAEENQKLLKLVPPESSIIVALSPAGKGVVKDLMVGEVPLATWIEEQNQQEK